MSMVQFPFNAQPLLPDEPEDLTPARKRRLNSLDLVRGGKDGLDGRMSVLYRWWSYAGVPS